MIAKRVRMSTSTRQEPRLLSSSRFAVSKGLITIGTATVLLFDSAGKFASTITPDEPDSAALAKLKALIG